MVNRRTLLQGALAATSIPIVGGLTGSPLRESGGAAAALDHPSLYKVVFDERFSAARAFGREAVARGHSVEGFDGDITRIWYHDLQPRWRQSRIAIAGLTAYSTLFCLEHLARDARLRVVQHAEHRYAGHEPLHSWVIA